MAILSVDHVIVAVPKGEGMGYTWATEIDGPVEDVLGRFARVLERWPEADPIVRVTADCPLLAPDIAQQVLVLYHDTPHCEYAWNVAPGYVDGTDIEVFSRDALLWAQREARDPYDREHVTPWIRRHCKVATLFPEADYSMHKWSVDDRSDLERVRAIAALLPPNDYRFATTLKAAEACISKV